MLRSSLLIASLATPVALASLLLALATAVELWRAHTVRREANGAGSALMSLFSPQKLLGVVITRQPALWDLVMLITLLQYPTVSRSTCSLSSRSAR